MIYVANGGKLNWLIGKFWADLSKNGDIRALSEVDDWNVFDGDVRWDGSEWYFKSWACDSSSCSIR